MRHFTFEKQWDFIKGQLKQRYTQLTDDDLTFIEGKGEELLARLREKLALSADQLNALLDELKTKAAGVAEDVRGQVGAAIEGVKAKGSAAADEVKAQANVAYDETRKRVRTFARDGEEYVRRNPRESLVAALCAGFVAGLLIRR